MSIFLNGLSVAIALTIALYFWRRFGTLISPPCIIAALWGGCMTLLLVPVVRYIEIPPLFWVIYSLAIINFALGAQMADALWKSKSRPLKEIERRRFVWVVNRVSIVMYVLGVIGAIAYFGQMHKVVGISALWNDSQTVRHVESLGELREVEGSGLQILYVCLVPAGVFMVMSIRYASGLVRTIRVTLGISIAFVLWLNSGRTAMISYVVTCGAAIGLMKKIGVLQWRFGRKSKVAVIMVVALLVLNFHLSNEALNKSIRSEDDENIMPLPEALQWIPTAYHYAVAPFAAFPHLVENRESFPPNGVLSFGFVSRILHQIWPLEFRYPLYVQPFSLTPLPTNVYTYLDSLYLDFGWPGVILGPLVIGFLATTTFIAALKLKTPLSLFVAAVIIYCCVSTIGVNRFGTAETWLWIGIASTVVWLVQLGYPAASKAN